jgi:hypothetical protein
MAVDIAKFGEVVTIQCAHFLQFRGGGGKKCIPQKVLGSQSVSCWNNKYPTQRRNFCCELFILLYSIRNKRYFSKKVLSTSCMLHVFAACLLRLTQCACAHNFFNFPRTSGKQLFFPYLLHSSTYTEQIFHITKAKFRDLMHLHGGL